MENTTSNNCLICFNSVESTECVWYTIDKESWDKFPYCIECINYLKLSLWNEYVKGLKMADCEKTLRNLINIGPPRHVRDSLISSNREILEFKLNEQIISSELANAPTVEQLLLLKQRLNDVIIILDKYNEIEINMDVDCLEDVMNVINSILDEY